MAGIDEQQVAMRRLGSARRGGQPSSSSADFGPRDAEVFAYGIGGFEGVGKRHSFCTTTGTALIVSPTVRHAAFVMTCCATAFAWTACSFDAPGVLTPDGPRADDATDADAGVDATDAVVGVDTDGDGLDDGLDNCPAKANADQTDYDGDDHGDACDKCPQVASAAEPDADSDGIGDACDPRPNNQDVRAVWFNFKAATALTGFTSLGKTWRLEGGFARQSSDSRSEGNLLSNVSSRATYVSAQFIVRSVTDPGFVGICSDVNLGTSAYCCFLGGGPPPVARATFFPPASVTPYVDTPYAGGFAVNQVTTVTQTLQASGNHCTLASGGAMGTSDTTGSTLAGFVELYTSGVAADFSSLFIVEIGS